MASTAPAAATVGKEHIARIRDARQAVLSEVLATQEHIYRQVDDWILDKGYETSEEGWRGDIYLYCIEVTVPESAYIQIRDAAFIESMFCGFLSDQQPTSIAFRVEPGQTWRLKNV